MRFVSSVYKRIMAKLGTAAFLNSGTSAGNVVVLDGSAKLPAVDGSQLTNLNGGAVAGLGTMSAQDANNVTITGGSISGITDLAVADGGTGASTAANARTNLGVGHSESLAASGYQTLPGGLVIQWGVTGTASSGQTTTNFATTFPTACAVVIPSSNAGSGSSSTADVVWCSSKSTSQAVIQHRSFAGGFVSYSTTPAFFIAIGY